MGDRANQANTFTTSSTGVVARERTENKEGMKRGIRSCGRWYGVRVGRNPGVYPTWEEARAQVEGFPGCVHQRFGAREDAERFVAGEKRARKQGSTVGGESDREVLEVYTDGNHYKGTSSMGFGIFCRFGGAGYALAQRLDATSSLDLFGKGLGELEVSNPSMELAAVAHLLKMCSRYYRGEGRYLIRVHSDYTGVAGWLEGSWRARQPHIRALVERCRASREHALPRFRVEFLRVEGHSGVAGNDAADALAKGRGLEGALPLEDLFRSLGKPPVVVTTPR